ncbi:uncharacterized protein MONOS_12932 [Monocercomonoides exilis]|uniref:uncharacterized protein n=1 Tax=Monocercomonoides exilis TaxID=2049356 RepID=UPI0035599A56|nr:hypothetical protein MONOS_12932 [Monocercomonoides exilis]|eukprot:MONOS_12932.1-p1 / transcript=MONOS_12932.1 / gene=MONOS_12932 / organism=Monocercomonoides_exilis_PA203 / gene_product=unspecified product / transcript_product=unspecified product / location=Mono_scaffold00755:2890-4667(+) / protein_length=386 / sequence_SO=supercontig / SO=protein_coding / is_pseudo=false
MKLEDCADMKMDSCVFDGSSKEGNEMGERDDGICRWNGSVVDFSKSSVMMKDTTILSSPDGGITVSGGNVIIEMGLFENNNSSIEGYPSLRRNIICSDSGTLNVMSLKGGDGVLPNSSLWMLNNGCSFEGIVSERDSSFFIPVLESVEAKEETDRMKLIFKGMLLVPCNLSFSVVKRKGEEKEIEKHDFDSNGFLSEREIEGSVAKDLISNCGNEIEVTIHSVQGNFTLGTRAMDVVDGKEVVMAVAELFEHLISVGDEREEMMGKQLCPYSIFVEEGNNEIYVLSEELEDGKQKEEMKRWMAPEAGEEDMEKTVVFTLGLILHEMTTGEVPLSECDEEEAQEMMRDGVRPLTEGIEGEKLIEVMEKMWGNVTDESLSLCEVIQLL